MDTTYMNNICSIYLNIILDINYHDRYHIFQMDGHFGWHVRPRPKPVNSNEYVFFLDSIWTVTRRLPLFWEGKKRRDYAEIMKLDGFYIISAD